LESLPRDGVYPLVGEPNLGGTAAANGMAQGAKHRWERGRILKIRVYVNPGGGLPGHVHLFLNS